MDYIDSRSYLARVKRLALQAEFSERDVSIMLDNFALFAELLLSEYTDQAVELIQYVTEDDLTALEIGTDMKKSFGLPAR